MQFFINEQSFHGQFYDDENLQRALIRLVKLVDRARRELHRNGGRIWRSHWLGNAQVITGQSLHQSLNHITGREFKESFSVVVYDMANPAPWEPERLHSSDDFYFWRIKPEAGDDPVVTDSSLAELAERRLRDVELLGCLLNLDGSKFTGRQLVEIVNESNDKAELPCTSSERELENWLQRVEKVPAYGPESTRPPSDEQTCLIDSTRFEATGRHYDHRMIYRHRTRRDLYYVDNLHSGRSAHLEVFDKHGRHLGEASLDGQLRPNTKIEGRLIDT